MEEKLNNWFGLKWREALGDYLTSPEFFSIARQVTKAREQNIVHPDKDDVFKAFIKTPYNQVTTVLLGQDPYPDSTACGLSFCCCKKLRPNASLKNMIIEINDEYPGNILDIHDFRLDLLDLERWSMQGILMLNTALTVEDSKAGSHLDIWKPFTIKVLEALNKKENIVYLLLGKEAQKYEKYISTRHRIVSAVHPASIAYNPKSGWWGNGCFKEVNECLESVNLKTINW